MKSVRSSGVHQYENRKAMHLGATKCARAKLRAQRMRVGREFMYAHEIKEDERVDETWNADN
jgi:hypothetical protein